MKRRAYHIVHYEMSIERYYEGRFVSYKNFTTFYSLKLLNRYIRFLEYYRIEYYAYRETIQHSRRQYLQM